MVSDRADCVAAARQKVRLAEVRWYIRGQRARLGMFFVIRTAG